MSQMPQKTTFSRVLFVLAIFFMIMTLQSCFFSSNKEAKSPQVFQGIFFGLNTKYRIEWLPSSSGAVFAGNEELKDGVEKIKANNEEEAIDLISSYLRAQQVENYKVTLGKTVRTFGSFAK